MLAYLRHDINVLGIKIDKGTLVKIQEPSEYTCGRHRTNRVQVEVTYNQLSVHSTPLITTNNINIFNTGLLLSVIESNIVVKVDPGMEDRIYVARWQVYEMLDVNDIPEELESIMSVNGIIRLDKVLRYIGGNIASLGVPTIDYVIQSFYDCGVCISKYTIERYIRKGSKSNE